MNRPDSLGQTPFDVPTGRLAARSPGDGSSGRVRVPSGRRTAAIPEPSASVHRCRFRAYPRTGSGWIQDPKPLPNTDFCTVLRPPIPQVGEQQHRRAGAGVSKNHRLVRFPVLFGECPTDPLRASAPSHIGSLSDLRHALRHLTFLRLTGWTLPISRCGRMNAHKRGDDSPSPSRFRIWRPSAPRWDASAVHLRSQTIRLPPPTDDPIAGVWRRSPSPMADTRSQSRPITISHQHPVSQERQCCIIAQRTKYRLSTRTNEAYNLLRGVAYSISARFRCE